MSRADYSKILELIELRQRLSDKKEETDISTAARKEILLTLRRENQQGGEAIRSARDQIHSLKSRMVRLREEFEQVRKKKEQRVTELRRELAEVQAEVKRQGLG